MAVVTGYTLGSIFTTTAGTKSSSGSPAPAYGDLVFIITAHTVNTAQIAPTDNNPDGLGTYSFIGAFTKNAAGDTMQAWVRNSLVSNTTGTQYTHNPGTTSGGGFQTFKVTGMSKAGLAAVRQFAGQSSGALGTTPAPVFAQACLTGNAVIGAILNATNPATMTPPASYTEINDVGYATPTTGFESVSRNSGETGTTITWGGTSSTEFASIVVEIDTSFYSPLPGPGKSIVSGPLHPGSAYSGRMLDFYQPPNNFIATTVAAITTVDATQGVWSWAGSLASTTQLINSTIGTWSWVGSQASIPIVIDSTQGTWVWVGSTSSTTQLINSTIGTWSWAGSTASTTQLINSIPGTWTWAGSTAVITAVINSNPGTWTWVGSTSNTTQLINSVVGTWTWAGSTASIEAGSITVNATVGAWTWVGSTASTTQLINAATGAWSWVGSQATIPVLVPQITGTWTWTGSVADIILLPTIYNISPTGNVTFSGTNLQIRTRVVTPTGNIIFNGTAVRANINVYEPTGFITFSGTGSLQFLPVGGQPPLTRIPLTGAGIT